MSYSDTTDMIYRYISRYIFPNAFSFEGGGAKLLGGGWTSPKHIAHAAILKTNRQINQEACSILYGESEFKVLVRQNSINAPGKCWDPRPHGANIKSDFSPSSALCQEIMRMIKDLEIVFSLVHGNVPLKEIGVRGITKEDYDFYALGDSMWKLANVLRSDDSGSQVPSSLKRLKVTLNVYYQKEWRTDEAVTALFFVLEPLKTLHVDLSPLEGPILKDKTQT